MSICGLADELSGFYDVAVFHLIARDFFVDRGLYHGPSG